MLSEARAAALIDACFFLPLGVLLSVVVVELFSGGRKGVDLEKAVVVLLIFGSVLFFAGGFLTFSQSAASFGREVAVKSGGIGVLLGVGCAVAAMLKQQCYLQKLMLLARSRTRRQHTRQPYLWPSFYFFVLLMMLVANGGMIWWRPDLAMRDASAGAGDAGLADISESLDADDEGEAAAVVSDLGATLSGEPEVFPGTPEPSRMSVDDPPVELVVTTVDPAPEPELESNGMTGGTEPELDNGASTQTIAISVKAVDEPGKTSSAGTVASTAGRTMKIDPSALRIFNGSVVPMLKDRCVSCHGPEKQKGDLRLDSPEWIRRGGSSGPVVLAFQPAKSYLYTSTTLPADDPDVMPAKGKPLTSAQTSAIGRWIKGGAPMGDGKDRKAASAAWAAMQKASDGNGAGNGGELSGSVAEQLAAAHIQYKPVAGGLFEIDCSLTRNYPEVKLDLEVLRPIAAKIHTLDLSKTKVRDADLEPVQEMVNLTRLLLSRTTVGDGALRYFSNLAKLEILNLYGTNVSDDGLVHLADLSNLKKLYLWNSKATSAGGDRLKRNNPDLEVNVGQ